ncbi:progestin and adipoQ receptor family member 3-like [Galendromus occidentalis]|uniref:Progestin and adipoQ receptor family member 3-like n=1 Tax=Galendromus occidentalis TaxID=34638 RepID=A0AAJ6QQF2_9ACAR|nr:progestin and adipoQ receptor family member 3-like [Galendromus occidentalis]
MSKMRMFSDIFDNDMRFLKDRISKPKSQSEICGVDDETRPFICAIEEAPKFQTTNRYITGGYRTWKSRESCIKGILQWTNETINIWSHLGPFIALLFRYAQDILHNFDEANFEPFDKKLCSLMILAYVTMFGLSSIYHVFNCCCCDCYRYWYGWDFIGICGSIYAYGTGFLFLQFRDAPHWIPLYAAIKTIILAVPIIMLFHEEYRDEKYDDHRAVGLGVFVVFNTIPTVHSIVLRGGLDSPVVRATLPTHLLCVALLVGSFIVYACQFPERFLPGRVNYIGNSHQIWHIGTATAVFHARHLYFQYVRALSGLT